MFQQLEEDIVDDRLYRWIYFLTLVFGKWSFCWGSKDLEGVWEAQFFETSNHDSSCWGLVSDLINGVGNKGWKPMATWLRKEAKTYRPSPDLPFEQQKSLIQIWEQKTTKFPLSTTNTFQYNKYKYISYQTSSLTTTTSPTQGTPPPQPPQHQAVDATSFMRQSETIEATTPEISVARTAVASYFSEVKKSLQVGRVGGWWKVEVLKALGLGVVFFFLGGDYGKCSIQVKKWWY